MNKEEMDVQVESYVSSMWDDRMRFGPETPLLWVLKGDVSRRVPYKVMAIWNAGESGIVGHMSTYKTAVAVLEALKAKEGLRAKESVLDAARAAYRRVELGVDAAEQAGAVTFALAPPPKRPRERVPGMQKMVSKVSVEGSVTKEMSDLWRGSMGGSRTIADALKDAPPMSRLHRMAEPHGYLSKIPGARNDWAPAQVVTYEQDLGEDLELSDAELRAWAKR
jgi:hypothetical protein